MMPYRLQMINTPDALQTYPVWLVLHGAFACAEQAVEMFGGQAQAMLAPQATRPCGQGYCWSFASDAAQIRATLDEAMDQYPLDPNQLSLVGYSMGCTMGLWLLAQNPGRFRAFAALGIGSAFERWELDDGGIDEDGLRQSSATTRILLAGDRSDPAGGASYFEDNLSRLTRAGFPVQTFRPDQGTHAVTDEMRVETVQFLSTHPAMPLSQPA